jgi:hypothetical protein
MIRTYPVKKENVVGLGHRPIPPHDLLKFAAFVGKGVSSIEVN